MNNRRLIVYSTIGAAVLLSIVVFLFVKLSADRESGGRETVAMCGVVYKAIPSDAVAILGVNSGAVLADMATGKKMPEINRELPAAVSMHYSAKNEVSLLWISQFTTDDGGNDSPPVGHYLTKRKYNSVYIYQTADTFSVAQYGSLRLWSKSPYVVESAVRHLENSTSILDNQEFASLVDRTSYENTLFINHHQIGKFFSGVVQRDYLKYSDFFLRFTSWSSYKVEGTENLISLSGDLENNGEERYYSHVFESQKPQKAEYPSFLPSQTAFAISIPFESVRMYLDGYKEFLEIHKKRGNYDYIQHITRIDGDIAPQEFIDSLNVREAVIALCSFGNKYEWVTLLRLHGQESVISNMFTGMFDREKSVEVKDFTRKGYVAAVFGPVFGNNKEESFCRSGDWIVIGPKEHVKGFAVGANKFFTLDDYIRQTSLNGIFNRESNVDVYANISFMPDSVLKIFKVSYASEMAEKLDENNFSVAHARLYGEGPGMKSEIKIYTANLEKLPEAPAADDDIPVVVTDSTIRVDNSEFELKDFTTGGKCYLQQSNNLSLRYLNGNRKALWTIPFSKPLCGMVEQVDFYSNNKLQMLMATSEELFLIDRLGRFVKGFPVKLHKPAVLGPKIFDAGSGKTGFIMLDEDNTVSIYVLKQNELAQPVEIRHGEFVREIPDVIKVGQDNYIVVRCVSQAKIYSVNGTQITGKEKKRRIAPDSELAVVDGGIEYTGTDKKVYIIDLQTGKSSLKR